MLKQIITKIEVVIAEAEYKVKNQTMGPKNTIFLALVVTLIAKESFAAQHVVGGSQGWDQSTDFKSWTSGQTFKVGDKLGMFLYIIIHWSLSLYTFA